MNASAWGNDWSIVSIQSAERRKPADAANTRKQAAVSDKRAFDFTLGFEF